MDQKVPVSVAVLLHSMEQCSGCVYFIESNCKHAHFYFLNFWRNEIKHHVERKCRRTAAGMLTVVCVVCQYVYTCNVCECGEEMIRPFSTHMFPHIHTSRTRRVFTNKNVWCFHTRQTKRQIFFENLHKKCVLIPSHLSHINCSVALCLLCI